jgi:hypothetical protein
LDIKEKTKTGKQILRNYTVQHGFGQMYIAATACCVIAREQDCNASANYYNSGIIILNMREANASTRILRGTVICQNYDNYDMCKDSLREPRD